MRSKAIFLILILGFIVAENAGAQIVDSLEQESGNEPPKGMEIISKRTWNSKTFLNADNTVTVEISSGYLHYQDRHGQFHEIDRRVVLAPDSAGYEVKKGLYGASFGFDLQKDVYPIIFEMPDRTRFRAKLTSLAYYNRASKQIVTLQNVQNTSAMVNGNKIRYPEAFDGVDVEYEYVDAKLKQYAYLSQKARDNLPDPQTLGLNPNNTDLVLVVQIDIPDSLEAFANNAPIFTKPQGKIRLAYEGEHKVEFRNTGGKPKFFLPSDFAFATLGRRADSTTQAMPSHRMWRRFFNSGNNNLMLTGVPVRWLSSQASGTIILDPNVTIQPPAAEGKDTFIYASNGGDDNHGALGQLQIGPDQTFYERRGLITFDLSAIPQTATITSATFQLYLFGNTGTATSFTIEAHKMLRNWVEGTGTVWDGGNTSGCDWHYADKPSNIFWNADGMQSGTDYNATVLGTALINLSDDEIWKSWPIALSAVQEWVATPSSNYGLALVTVTGDIGKAIVSQFYSSDNTLYPTLRPRLLINYTVNPLVDITYDALSRPTTITYANGVTETNQYNIDRHWLTRRDYKQGTTNIYYFKSDLSTDFDKAGNLKHVEYKHKSDAAQTMDYVYNRLYRHTQFTPSGGAAKSYGYDRNGNLNSFEGLTFTYPNKNNQLKEVKNGTTVITTYLYDKAGRVNQINSTSVTHNLHSNMTAHGSNTYVYDAFGQRIRKTEGGTSKYYITSGPQVLAEYSNNSGPDAEYIYALGRMISKFDPTKGYLWFYVDHLGSTRLVDGPDSQTDMRRDYYPYGQAYLAAGTDQTAYQFTGKELDNVTGLYYFGARYYDRSIGRWLVPDPAGQFFSPYIYGGNNPINYVDKDGKIAWIVPVIGAVLGGVTAGIYAYRLANGNLSGRWGEFWKAVGIGALTGGLAVFAPGFWAVPAAGLSAGITSAGTQHLMLGRINWGDVGIDFTVAAGTAGIVKYAPIYDGKTLGKLLYDDPANMAEGVISGLLSELAYQAGRPKQSLPTSTPIVRYMPVPARNQNIKAIQLLISVPEYGIYIYDWMASPAPNQVGINRVTDPNRR